MGNTRKRQFVAAFFSIMTFFKPCLVSASMWKLLKDEKNQTIRFVGDDDWQVFICVLDRLSEKCKTTDVDMEKPIPQFLDGEWVETTFWSQQGREVYNSLLSVFVLANSTENLLSNPFLACCAKVVQETVEAPDNCSDLSWISVIVVPVGVGLLVALPILTCMLMDGFGFFQKPPVPNETPPPESKIENSFSDSNAEASQGQQVQQ